MPDIEHFRKDLDRIRKEQLEYISGYFRDNFDSLVKIRNKKVMSQPDESSLDKILAIDIPLKGRDPREVCDELVTDVLDKSMNLHHPRFFSFVTSYVSPFSVVGSVLTDIYNPNLGGYENAPEAALIEEKLIKWMGSLAGFGDTCGGIFTSGGSLSNLTCMIAAREKHLPGRYDLADGAAFYSDQAHSSIVKGLRLMGLRSENCFKIPTDSDFKMDTEELEKSVAGAEQKGLKPFLVVATAGTTNTGTIDPMNKIADVAEKHGMWMHVDGAFGGSVLFSDIYRNLTSGIERADSLSWDTHKWALQVYSCSCAIAKNKQDFINAFHEHPEYLADVINAEHNDGWDLGIEMSRPARFLKLWTTIQCIGTELLSELIDYAFYTSKQAENKLSSLPEWEIVSHSSCGTVCFRYVPSGISPDKYDEINAVISQKIRESGYAVLFTTVLKGKKVIRMCCINGNTDIDDVLSTVEKLNEIAESVKKDYQ